MKEGVAFIRCTYQLPPAVQAQGWEGHSLGKWGGTYKQGWLGQASSPAFLERILFGKAMAKGSPSDDEADSKNSGQ